MIQTAGIEVFERALGGSDPDLTAVVDSWTPIVQARVVRVLCRSGYQGNTRMRQEIEDFVQEVFISLFEKDAKALRAWKASGGLSLQNWVGLIAERQVLSILRTGKRNPWTEEPTPIEDFESASEQSDLQNAVIASDELERLLDRLQEELSPLGWELFNMLYVQDLSVDEVSESLEMSHDAVYAWRSRLRKTAKKLAASPMSEIEGSHRMSKGGEES